MNFVEKINAAHGKRVLVGGHRGHLSDTTRENTIPNFEEAKAMGVDYIEIDVQLTKDGQAVIFHDFELSDRTPLAGRIHDYTAAQLKESFEINTLEEALTWCRENDMCVLLEIKCRECEDHNDMPSLGREIVSVLEKLDLFDGVIVFGTNYNVLHTIQTLDSRANIALIVPQVPVSPGALMREMNACIYLCYADNLSSEIINELHENGYTADGSVVNTTSKLAQAVKMGCDMVESDYPEKIIAALE